MKIIYKTSAQMDAMKRVGALAYELLDLAEEIICPGISTGEISRIIHERTLAKGARSAPLGYRGFPEACCTSVNEVVCHGIPDAKHILQAGDIINVDVTPILNGFHGDTSRTFYVGGKEAASPLSQRLVECARESLAQACAATRDGCTVLDLAKIICQNAHAENFSVVRDFVGHGIGAKFHEDPNIQHCAHIASKQEDIYLRKGMTFTIEPMINAGTHHTKVLSDGWTAVTWDGKRSAQFEHTLGIRENGAVEIFTLP